MNITSQGPDYLARKTALDTSNSVFLFGPAGTGKTVLMAQRLNILLDEGATTP